MSVPVLYTRGQWPNQDMHDARQCVGMYKRSFRSNGRCECQSETVRKICVAASTAKRISPGPFPQFSESKRSQAWDDVSQEDRKRGGLSEVRVMIVLLGLQLCATMRCRLPR